MSCEYEAGYLAATLPFGSLNVFAGLRYEYSKMELITNTRDDRPSPLSHFYKYNDLFPSLNATYKFSDKHQLRLSYGKTVNRPEFREVSPSVFYDFDLAADVKGNTELRLTNDDIEAVMEQNRQELNAEMPAYSKLSAIKIQEEEFEKTPKKSIKRYLYQNA